jgi:hypothetical protein
MDKKAHAHPKKFGCGSAALGGSVANIKEKIMSKEVIKLGGKKKSSFMNRFYSLKLISQTQNIVYIGCMHPGFFSQFVALSNHPEALIPVRNPIPLRNFFTRSPCVKRVWRNGISFVNPVINPYDPGITFPDSSV